MSLKLTIAIPTYGRPASLADTVARLLPQLTGDTELLILDNHSPQPAQDVLAALLARFPLAPCRFVRHRVNVGGNTNVLRCFEYAEGTWVWTLGDDDRPAADAVGQIFSAIDEYTDADHINFCTSIQPARTDYRASNLDEYLDRCDSLSNALFISSNIYKREQFLRYLPAAFELSGTNMAQLVVLFAALNEQHVSVSTHRFLVFWEAAPVEQRWPPFVFFHFLEAAQVFPTSRHQRKFLGLLAFAEGSFKSGPLLRWAALSQYTRPSSPSALLFLARGARLRAILYPKFRDRFHWSLVGCVAALLHRHQPSFMCLWRVWHRVRHHQPLRPSALSDGFFGNHSHLKNPHPARSQQSAPPNP
jgi:glycosyltransferase involved in cell wall biosynthesis